MVDSKVKESTFGLLRPNGFNFIKGLRKVINNPRTISIPPPLMPVNTYEDLRLAQSFEKTPVGARRIPTVDEIVAREIEEKGIKVNIGVDNLVSKMFNKFMAIPKRNAKGEIIINPDTKEPVTESKSLGEMLKTLNDTVEGTKVLLIDLKREVRRGRLGTASEIVELKLFLRGLNDGILDALRRLRRTRPPRGPTIPPRRPSMPTREGRNIDEGLRLIDEARLLQQQTGIDIFGSAPILPNTVSGVDLLDDPNIMRDIWLSSRGRIIPNVYQNFLIDIASLPPDMSRDQISVNTLIENLISMSSQAAIGAPDRPLPITFIPPEEEEEEEEFELKEEKESKEEQFKTKKREEGPNIGLPFNPKLVTRDYINSVIRETNPETNRPWSKVGIIRIILEDVIEKVTPESEYRRSTNESFYKKSGGRELKGEQTILGYVNNGLADIMITEDGPVLMTLMRG